MSESNDRRIDDATPDTDVTGVEKVPVSDGGTPKCLTVEQIKDFVAAKFASLQNATGVAVNADGVYLKKDGELKPVAANVFADAIVTFVFGKDAETELAETDEIVIRRGTTAKVATIADIAGIVSGIVQPPNIDIESLPEAGISIGDHASGWIAITVPTVIEGHVVQKTYKTEITNVCNGIVNFAFNNSGDPSDAFDPSNDKIAIAVLDGNGEYELKLVEKSVLIGGVGNVKGPSSNTANNIPQWNGADSKTLKDGLSVASTVGSGSTSNEIPTAASVHTAITNRTAAMVNGPSSNTDNKIPQWNGTNTRALKDGLTVATSISEESTNSEVPTALAVKSAITGATENIRFMTGPSECSDNEIPLFNGTDPKKLKRGAIWYIPKGTQGSSHYNDSVCTRQEVEEIANDTASSKVGFSLETDPPSTNMLPIWTGSYPRFEYGAYLRRDKAIAVHTGGVQSDAFEVPSLGYARKLSEIRPVTTFHLTNYSQLVDPPEEEGQIAIVVDESNTSDVKTLILFAVRISNVLAWHYIESSGVYPKQVEPED